MTTVFGKIINGELPAEIIYESDCLLVIKDIHPVAPVHLLIIPKKEIKDLQSLPQEDLSIIQEVALVAQKMADKFGISTGYRLITNNGPQGGQEVYHLHFHLIGGRQLGALG